MPSTDFHPDLAKVARFAPRSLVGPRTLKLVRKIQPVVQRGSGRDVEALILRSGVRVRLHRPTGATAPGPALLWIHGGGYIIGSAAQDDDLCRRFVRELGVTVAAVDYRLAPEHPYPAAVDDARTVVSAALRAAAPGTVIVSGDSAGGGLALVTALALPDTTDGAARLAGCILLSPWLDLTADWTAVPELVRRDVMLSPAWLEACARAYVPTGDRAHLMVSPLHANLADLPPLLIQCGTDDLVAPDSENLAVRAEAAGVDVTYSRWPGMWHDFVLQPDIIAAADSAVAQAAWFVARAFAPDGRSGG